MLDAWSGSKQSILLVKAPMTEASSNAYLDCAPHGILASSPLSLKRCPSQCTRHASNVRLLNHHWHRPSPSTHFNRYEKFKCYEKSKTKASKQRPTKHPALLHPSRVYSISKQAGGYSSCVYPILSVVNYLHSEHDYKYPKYQSKGLTRISMATSPSWILLAVWCLLRTSLVGGAAITIKKVLPSSAALIDAAPALRGPEPW